MKLRVKVKASFQPALSHPINELVNSNFVKALLNQDSTIWGELAADEARQRLGWTLNPSRWFGLAKKIDVLRDNLRARGINRFLLCGMGGSSLGPEVIAKNENLNLQVIDSTHPDELARLLNTDLSNTLVIVASKSGGTLETECHRIVFEKEFMNQGLDPAKHLVVVTDPGSPLYMEAKAKGYPLFEGDPKIGGRYSALSPFGLVPTGLAGLDLIKFIEDAEQGFQLCTDPGESNPALKLGTAIAAEGMSSRKLLFYPDPKNRQFFDWVEQLIAESSGKDGKGILPLKKLDSSKFSNCTSVGGPGSGAEVEVSGSLGAQMILWLFAIAVACARMRVNPFDQPNVESSKVVTRELLQTSKSRPTTIGKIANLDILQTSRAEDLKDYSKLESLIHFAAKGQNYIAICAFAPRQNIDIWEALQRFVSEISGKPVTLGFGPRFLHSTGQLHKGGPQDGGFFQIIQYPSFELPVPGRDFSFNELVFAQATGDAQVLESQGRPLIRLGGDFQSIKSILAS